MKILEENNAEQAALKPLEGSRVPNDKIFKSMDSPIMAVCQQITTGNKEDVDLIRHAFY